MANVTNHSAKATVARGSVGGPAHGERHRQRHAEPRDDEGLLGDRVLVFDLAEMFVQVVVADDARAADEACSVVST